MEENKKEEAKIFINQFVDNMIRYAITISKKENATPAELEAMTRIACKILETELDVHLV